MTNKITRFISSKSEQAFRLFLSRYLSHFLDVVLIVEYPKSGGTWLGQLVSDYLNIPFPRNKFPGISDVLIHSHYLPHKSYRNVRKVLWLTRDGRDVMISLYYHYLIWSDKNKLNPKDVYYHRSQVPFDNYEDIKDNLPQFIKYVFDHRPPKLQQLTYPGSWFSFNLQWLKAFKSGILDIERVNYEDLLADTVKELKRILTDGFGISDIDETRINQIVDRYSFERQTKREKGEEQPGSFLRKGVAGDWLNYFSKESALLFDQYAGSLLIDLGYEKDENWIEKYFG